MSTPDRLFIFAALVSVVFDAPSWLPVALLLLVLFDPFPGRGR